MLLLSSCWGAASPRLNWVRKLNCFIRNPTKTLHCLEESKASAWLASYRDLLGERVDRVSLKQAGRATTTPPSLLASLLGDFLPYLTGATEQTTQVSRIKRLGLAEETDR